MKNKKKFEKPALVCSDDLAVMLDDELFAMQKRLEAERQFLLVKNDDATLWEIELCYVKRELSIRETRSNMHKAYLNTTNQLQNNHYDYVDESSLSTPDDLENVEFVKLCAQRDYLKQIRTTKSKKLKGNVN